MDVDRPRPRNDYPVVCHHCHKTGPYTLECPQGYDIQTMTAEEKLELLLELLVLADGSEAWHIESKPKVTRGLRPEEEMLEDFASSSG